MFFRSHIISVCGGGGMESSHYINAPPPKKKYPALWDARPSEYAPEYKGIAKCTILSTTILFPFPY